MPQDSNLIRIPAIALSVRQPWAWAIVVGIKDIENRTEFSVRAGRMVRRRVAVHAAKGLTQDEYNAGAAFMLSLGVQCPAPADLLRGGIIGAVDVVDIVKSHESPWFSPGPPSTRPRGLVLANPQTCAYVPAVGQLGYFQWTPADPPAAPEPAAWMLRKPDAGMVSTPAVEQIDMFG